MESQNQIPASGNFEDKVIRAIYEETALVTGRNYFSTLVYQLCSVLKTSGAWVTEYYEDQRELNSLAFWFKENYVNEYRYKIDGTPCKNVILNSRYFHVKENVKSLFPLFLEIENLGAESYMGYPLTDVQGKLIGHLAVIDFKAMTEVPKILEIIKVFAARAAAELQRIKSENEIKEKERKLRRLIESAMDGIIEIDNNLIVTMMNPAAEKLFNCKSSEIIGTCFLDILQEEGQLLFVKTVKQLIDKPEGEKFIWITDSLKVKCGENKEFSAEATVSQYESRKETYYSIILRNINDRIEAEQKIHSLEVEAEYLKEELKILNKFDTIVGQSRPIMKLLHEVSLVAKTDSTVLIYGETGTGKELVAKAIHSASNRKDKQLININCSAIPGFS